MRAQGRLTFVKIEIQGDDDKEWDRTNEIMDLFDIDEISGSNLLIFHLEENIKKSKIKTLKAIKGVKRVSVY